MSANKAAHTSDAPPFERWPVACALMWIRGVQRNWSLAVTEENIRRARRLDARAFSALEVPIEEAQSLLNFAAADSSLVLYHESGKFNPSQLGPDAFLVPAVDPLGNHTFGLWPRPKFDIEERFYGIWCLRRAVEAAWPHPSSGAVQAPRVKAGRKAGYPWGAARATVMQKLDEDGPPIPDTGEPGWQSQADLEKFISNWMLKRLGGSARQPASSTVRGYAVHWLKEWRASRARS